MDNMALENNGCLPTKVKRSESGFGWRRKGSSKNHSRRASTASSSRPTLLLPPMRCSNGTLYLDDASTTVPVVTSRVQQRNSDGRTFGHFLSTDNNLHCPVPEPSAPSPGHLFYNSEDHSDMAFIVGQEEWRFPAHSFILSKTEMTMRTLLQTAREEPRSEETTTRVKSSVGSSPRSEHRQSLVLKLPDIQPDVFEQMLRYIYTGQVSFSSVESTLRLLQPSKTYHLPQLTSLCLGYLSQHVTSSNVLTVLSHLLCPEQRPVPSNFEECHDNDNERNELLFKCFLVVDCNADSVLQGEVFETLEHELMIEIIKRDTLEVSSEMVVFDSVMKWACRACKKQRKELTPENKCLVLGKALFLVRYLVMTPDEFLRGPISQGMLCKEDKDAFLSRLTGATVQLPIADRWSAWKISTKRQRPQNLLSVTSPGSDLVSTNTETSVSPSNSIQPVNSNNKRNGDHKKKSMSKKLLNGMGDLVICVIQLLD